MKEESQNQKNKQELMLDDHKKMLIMTGKISDFQLKNLKTWPFILFDKVDKVELEYDFSEMVSDGSEALTESIGAGKIAYNIKLDSVPSKENIETLKNWTKFLFWNDTLVEINIKV